MAVVTFQSLRNNFIYRCSPYFMLVAITFSVVGSWIFLVFTSFLCIRTQTNAGELVKNHIHLASLIHGNAPVFDLYVMKCNQVSIWVEQFLPLVGNLQGIERNFCMSKETFTLVKKKKNFFFYFHFVPLLLQCIKSTKNESHNNKLTIIE